MKRHSLAGRPAWYEVETGSIKRPLVIGIAGGSASGKTSVSKYPSLIPHFLLVTSLTLTSARQF